MQDRGLQRRCNVIQTNSDVVLILIILVILQDSSVSVLIINAIDQNYSLKTHPTSRWMSNYANQSLISRPRYFGVAPNMIYYQFPSSHA
ncbi:hypothetical protein CEXT_554721 [Caerostris extrusa]|uniref:Uncharacterized protein n=1 Tax=Caerostris extrusa TaxID=172846 RepID=A0AAV4S1V1_CAEEX|nr:hypothetical protein CEXT_554721 [Caerostris extrusa]